MPVEPSENPRITVQPGVGGTGADGFAVRLRSMYAAWPGGLDGEEGIHQLHYVPDDDPLRRIYTATARVLVDGKSSDERVRTYSLVDGSVTDRRTGRVCDDVDRVLGGDLSLLRDS